MNTLIEGLKYGDNPGHFIILGTKKNCLFALHRLPLFFDPHLKKKIFIFFTFIYLFFFTFHDILFSCCFKNLMIADNLFSPMCTIALTIPQFLHVVYDITMDRAPGRFSSHHC